MKRSILLSFSLLLTTALTTGASALAADSSSRATSPCTGNEEWNLSSAIPSSARSRFEDGLSGKASAAVGYAEASALERSGSAVETRIFGAYWKNRSLLQAKLDHAAADGFAAIAAATPQRETYGVQAAALACLNQLRLAHPGLMMPRSVTGQIPQYLRLARSNEDRQAAWDFATAVLKDQIVMKASASEAMATLSLLKGAGAAEAFAKGLWFASHNEHAQTVAALEKWLKGPTPSMSASESIEKQIPHARLLLARAYYTLGKYDLAAEQYGRVDTKSNEIAEALTERAWSQLMAGKYADAVGSATSLEAGALRNTYAPEAEMVMAMSLNELCQFPDSLRATKLLSSHYDSTHQWLRQWASMRPESRPSLYSLTVQHLKGQGSGAQVPTRLASEWIKNNRFIALQEEISSLFRETDAANEFRKLVATERTELNDKVRDAAADANVGVREDRGVLRVFAANAPAELKAKIATFNLLGEALAEWEAQAAARSRNLGELQKRMVGEINRELTARSLRMLGQLEDVHQNTQLIAVEIYQGASHDMIWQNAHPDFRDKVDPNRLESQVASAAHVLKFGRVNQKAIAENGKLEVWEDEIGAFKANLNDACSSKEKYLALADTKRRK